MLKPPERMKSKFIDYTLAILKPSIVMSQSKSRQVISKIKENNFEIYSILYKTLSKEEIHNLYYKHTKQQYFDDIIKVNSIGPSCILVLINKNETYHDSNSMEVKYKSPITRWKDMIGPKNPIEDKNKSTLRGNYGSSIIDNSFYGSDNPSEAYKDISCFYLKVPVHVPEFTFDVYKISLSTLIRFLFPLVPNHPDVTGRLDLFAYYGPVKDYHKLDQCFCSQCKYILKKDLVKERKMMCEIDKVLSDDYLSTRLNKLCEECNSHVLRYSHLFGGQQESHILTNSEIDLEIENLNKTSLVEVLEAEKGSNARLILQKIDINSPPKEIIYGKEHVKELLSKVDTDYYNRFDYKALQNLILEDRRVRINYWIGSVIGKPSQKFKIPQMINSLTREQVTNMNSNRFTLLRHKPISVKDKEEEELKEMIILHPLFVKQKLSEYEIKNMIIRLYNRNYYKIGLKENRNSMSMVSNLILMRNYDLENLKKRGVKNVEGLRKLEKEEK